MPSDVAGTAQALHLLKAETGAVGHLASRCGKRLSQEPVQQTNLPHISRAGGGDAKHQFAQIARGALLHGLYESHAQLESRTVNFEQHRVHAFCTSAGRQADDPAGLSHQESGDQCNRDQ